MKAAILGNPSPRTTESANCFVPMRLPAGDPSDWTKKDVKVASTMHVVGACKIVKFEVRVSLH